MLTFLRWLHTLLLFILTLPLFALYSQIPKPQTQIAPSLNVMNDRSVGDSMSTWRSRLQHGVDLDEVELWRIDDIELIHGRDARDLQEVRYLLPAAQC